MWCRLRWYYHEYVWLQTGFWTGDWIDHFTTRLGTTSNYSATANLHTLQINTAPVKSFPACCAFTSRSLVMASNSGDSSASALESSLNGGSLLTLGYLIWSSQTPAENWLGQGQSHSYFTTIGFPPISSSWRKAPWDPWPIFFSTDHLWS
jgi:hypothetical protein